MSGILVGRRYTDDDLVRLFFFFFVRAQLELNVASSRMVNCHDGSGFNWVMT